MVYELVQLTDSIIRSVLIGSLYTMLALGLSFVMAILKLPNLAHGELITIGAYVAVWLSFLPNTSVFTIIVPAFIITAVLGVAFNFLVYRPLERRHAKPLVLMIAFFALGLILRAVIFLFADLNDVTYYRPQVASLLSIEIGNTRITDVYISIPIALASVIVLHQLLTRTVLGKSMRAIADDKNLAVVVGINAQAMVLAVWILASGLAGIGGALWSVFTAAQPDLGWNLLFTLFAAALLGGFTFYGTILGAFVLAFVENTGMEALNQLLGLSVAFRPTIPLLVIVAVLLIRPHGLRDLSLFASRPLRTRKRQ